MTAKTTLSEVLLRDVVHPTKFRPSITYVYGNDNVRHSLKVMAERGVLSLPVSSVPTGDLQRSNMLGFVSVMDIVTYLINNIKTSNVDLRDPESWSGLAQFMETPTCNVIGADYQLLPKRTLDDPLPDVIREHFVLFPHVSFIHRIALFDARNRVSDIVSQSDLMRFLAARPDLLGPLGTKTLDELALVKGAVMMRGDEPAIAGFQILVESRVSGVCVVDEDGCVVTNLSASDLRGVAEEDLPLLARPVTEFLQTKKAAPLFGMRGMHPAVTCTAFTSIADVIRTLAIARVHRVYVTDSASRPIGVVTMSDVLDALTAPPDLEGVQSVRARDALRDK